MKVLGLDPGRTTGVAIFKDSQISYDESMFDHAALYRFLERLNPDFIVCEEFTFRKGNPQGVDLYPAELVGIVHYYSQLAGKTVYLQVSSVQGKKAYFSDAELKRLGLYLKGVQHGRSAVKHLLHWLQFSSGAVMGYDIEKLELVDFEWVLNRLFSSPFPKPIMTELH